MLHKLNGLGMLYRMADGPSDKDDRYHGYFVFPSKKEVKKRFKSGKPLSCFCLDGNRSEVHVAFKNKIKDGEHDISYLTFHCRHGHLNTYETGVFFCKFESTGTRTLDSKAEMNITDYALMLPYVKDGYPFQQQFTLIYSDWQVLVHGSKNDEAIKGNVTVDRELFNKLSRHY